MFRHYYRGADKSLARPGRKQANVSVRAACLALQEKKLDDSSRLDIVEIARVADMLQSSFPSWLGEGLSQHPGTASSVYKFRMTELCVLAANIPSTYYCAFMHHIETRIIYKQGNESTR